jgi:hypothetical protein
VAAALAVKTTKGILNQIKSYNLKILAAVEGRHKERQSNQTVYRERLAS